MAVSQDLILDRAVRDWVLVPLTLTIGLIMILRQYATQVCHRGSSRGSAESSTVRQAFDQAVATQMGQGPGKSSKTDPKEIREKQAVARSQLLRANCGFIPEAGFRQRAAYFSAKVRSPPHPPPPPLFPPSLTQAAG